MLLFFVYPNIYLEPLIFWVLRRPRRRGGAGEEKREKIENLNVFCFVSAGDL